MQKVLDSFLGNPDIDWWRRMVSKVKEGSGGCRADGWLGQLFPYDQGFVERRGLKADWYQMFDQPAYGTTPAMLIDEK
jgi:hypothetical protein